MDYKQIYDYSNKEISKGYIYTNLKSSNINLNIIVESVVNNILVYDTENKILDNLLIASQNILNDPSKLFIGLTSDKNLRSLNNKGIKNGFFRSTNEKSKCAIIIVDNKNTYAAFDENHIYELSSSYTSEIFKYINHLIWSKTTFEFCQGRMSEISNSRFSIVKPILKEIDKSQTYDIATKNLNGNMDILENETETSKDSIVLLDCTKSAFVDNNGLNINLFDNAYYAIEDWSSLVSSKSFINKSYAELIGYQLWVNNRKINIKKNDIIEKTIYLPVDEYKNAKPDFDSISKEYNDYSISLEVVAHILPMKLDNKYNISSNYTKLKQFETMLNLNIAKLKKLAGEDKKAQKQIETIENEKILSEKVNLYNKFIDTKDFGIESLNNNKKQFTKLTFVKDYIVPSELIGKLYTKDQKMFLALSNEDKVEEAKKWLKENNLEAVLILG